MAKQKTEKKPLLNIFDVLKNINNKKYQYLKTLTPEECSAFQPYLTQRWLCATPNSLQYYLLNEVCNRYLNSVVGKHSDLCYKLFNITSQSSNTRYAYIAPKTKKSSKKAHVNVIAEYYNISTKIAEKYAALTTIDDIINMAEELGYQAADIKALK